MSLWKTIPEIRKLLESPLFANRYVGLFTPESIFGNIGYMMNSINFPTFSYNTRQQYIGGVMTNVTNLYEQGTVDLTIYNTGEEFHNIYTWGEMHYNQKKRTYGYMNDIYAELKIYEYDRAANKVLEHRFHKCSLYTYGGIQLSYEEAQQVETFQTVLHFRSYECVLPHTEQSYTMAHKTNLLSHN